MLQVRDEWVGRLLSNPDVSWETLKEKTAWIYGMGRFKNKKPIAIVLDSPLATQIAMNMLIHKKVLQVESQVRSQVGSQVGSQVWSQVRSQVERQVRSQVESQVGSQVWSQVESQNLEYTVPYFGTAYDAGWLSFYDFFARIKVITNKKLNDYINSNKLFYEIFYFDGYIFATRFPKKILREESGQLHSMQEAAVQWRDGHTNHFIRGVPFTEELWLKIHNKELTPEEAIKLENIEQRTVSLQEIGYQIVLQKLGAKELDVHKEIIVPNSAWDWVLRLVKLDYKKEIEYKLYELDLKDHDKPARFVQVEWFTSDGYKKETLLRVHPDCQTAMQAVGWTFQDDQYNNEVES